MRQALKIPLLALLVSAAALLLRLGGGPGPAYQHVSDDPLYMSQAFYLSTTLSEVPRSEGGVAGGSAPPLTQLLLALSPAISPLRLVPIPELSDGARPMELLTTIGGKPYALAYLPVGSDPDVVQRSFERLYRETFGAGLGPIGWVDDLRSTLEAGDPAIVSLVVDNSLITLPPPIRISYEPRVVVTAAGLEIFDEVTGELVGRFRSDGVRSFAITTGADDPASVVVAVADRRGAMSAWRIVNRELYPIGFNRAFLFTDDTIEVHSLSPGPSGDLLIASAVAPDGGWELVVYDTVGPVAPLQRVTASGPIDLSHDRAARESYATDELGQSWRIEGGPIAGGRLLVGLVGALGAFFAFLLGRRLGGLVGGASLGTLFAVDPLGVSTGRVAYLEQPLATLSVAALLTITYLVSTPNRSRTQQLVLLGCIAGLAMATKWFAIPIVLAGLLISLFSLPAYLRRLAIALICAGLLSAVVIGALSGLALLLLLPLVMAMLAPYDPPAEGGLRSIAGYAAGLFIGYALPWAVYVALLSIGTGLPALEYLYMFHQQIIDNVGRSQIFPVSVWWLWPTALSTDALPSTDLEPIVMAPGVILAAGLVAVARARSTMEIVLAALLVTSWGYWSFLERHQMTYYALLPTLFASALLVSVAESQPARGRLVIGLALLAPLAGALAFSATADAAPLLIAVGGLAYLAANRTLTRRGVPFIYSIFAWPLGSLAAIAASISGAAALALVAGFASAVAAGGGWRAAPIGAAAAGGMLLVPDVVRQVGYSLPNGLRPESLLGAAPQTHPVGVFLFFALIALLALVTRRSFHKPTPL